MQADGLSNVKRDAPVSGPKHPSLRPSHVSQSQVLIQAVASISRAGAASLVVLVTATLWGCATHHRIVQTGTIASGRESPLAPTLASECDVVEDVEALSRAPRSPYPDSIASSDDGVRRLVLFWPPPERLDAASWSAPESEQAGARYLDPSIGFDATRTSWTIYTGFVWCTISAVFFRRELAVSDLRCRWDIDESRARCIAQRYRAIFVRAGISVRGTEARARADFPSVIAEMHRTRLRAMGEVETYALAAEPNAPQRLRAAETLLGDPLASLTVGGPGVQEANQLLEANAIDALRRVLRGSNPEGRGLAAVALSKLHALSSDDWRVIERLKETSSVATQGGCMVTVGPAREFFNDLTSLHDLLRFTAPHEFR